MMLRLRTEIERTPLRQLVGCREGVLLLGSCFTDNIGGWMVDHWLPGCWRSEVVKNVMPSPRNFSCDK